MTRNLLLLAILILLVATVVSLGRRGNFRGAGEFLEARIAFASSRSSSGSHRVRPPAVAGAFYPEEKEALRGAVSAFLRDARAPRKEAPIALVAPHAGYVFSGQIAADSWNQAAGSHPEVIVILGTNHTQGPFSGVSLYDGEAYETPLGQAKLDRELIAQLRRRDLLFVFKPKVHEKEHSVEVQIPFAQILFPGVPLVCGVVGDADLRMCERAGHALAEVLKGKRVLIVASSDLSHYPDRDTAIEVDRFTLDQLVQLDPAEFLSALRRREREDGNGLVTCACGKAPIMTMMTAARDLGARDARVVSYANSGETSLGNRDRCVGYGAVAVWPGPARAAVTSPPARSESSLDAPLSKEARQWLLHFARKTLHQYLTTQTTPLARDAPAGLWRKQGAFVTLTTGGHRLRGCIGHIPADTPLCVVVGQMGIQAATGDPRFPPLRPSELPKVEIEISALTPPRPIGGPEEIVLGRDGVILRKGRFAAVYLPQVAPEQGWNVEQMLSHLSQKAGLGPDEWRHGARFETFQAEVFHE